MGATEKRKKRKAKSKPDHKARSERLILEAAEELQAEQRRRAFDQAMASLALSKPAFGPRKRPI
jgi:hypothetical protein